MTGTTESLSVLVVDDSEFFASLVGDTLAADHGMSTTTITTARDVLSDVALETYDCIVSDYQMPDLDGLELYQAVADRDDIPFIVVTGEGDEKVASQAIQMGVDEYILKEDINQNQSLELLANRIQSVVERRRTQQKYRRLVDNSPDEISHVRLDGTILAVNDTMTRAFSTSRSTLVGKQLSAILPEDVAADRLEQGKRATTAGSAVTFQDSIGLRHFHNIAVPLDTRSGEDSVQFVTREITLQKHNEEELKRKEKELQRQKGQLEQFNSVLTHDLRNPLNIIDGYTEQIKTEQNTGQVEAIERSVSRIRTIIDDTLSFYQESEDVEEYETVAIDIIANKAWEHVDTGDSDLRIEDKFTLECSSERIIRLFENLYRNAVEHNEEPITVEIGTYSAVGTSTRESWDGFYIADSGTGIDEDQREEVFEFGETSSRDGTGLGLAIVERVADAHGWDINLMDSTDGGAKFAFIGVDME